MPTTCTGLVTLNYGTIFVEAAILENYGQKMEEALSIQKRCHEEVVKHVRNHYGKICKY